MSPPLVLPPRYELLAPLGSGAFGAVLRCRDHELDRLVAMKILVRHVDNADVRQRFAREGAVAAALRHPHVVAVFDSGTTPDGYPFLVTDLIEGGSLEDLLQAEGAQDPARCRRWVEQLEDALEALHETGILHRDVKPANVFRRGDDVLLGDFGLALFEDRHTRLTATGRLVGTPRYFAPEVLRGAPASPESDLFSLGALGYELAYGEPWWPRGSLSDMMLAAQSTLPPPRARFGRDPELDAQLRRLLDPDPARRARREDAGDLDAPGPEPDPGSTMMVRRPGADRSSGALAAGAVLLALAGGWWFAPGTSEVAPPGTDAASLGPPGTAPTAPEAGLGGEPAELTAAREAFAAGREIPGEADLAVVPRTRLVNPSLIDPVAPLRLRRLVRALAAAPEDADLEPALAAVRRLVERIQHVSFVVVRGAFQEYAEPPLGPTDTEAFVRAEGDMKQVVRALLEELPAPGAAPLGVLRVQLLLLVLAEDHPLGASVLASAAGRVGRLDAPRALALVEDLGYLLGHDKHQGHLPHEALATCGAELARGVKASRDRDPAAWRAVVKRTGSILVALRQRLGPTPALDAGLAALGAGRGDAG